MDTYVCYSWLKDRWMHSLPISNLDLIFHLYMFAFSNLLVVRAMSLLSFLISKCAGAEGNLVQPDLSSTCGSWKLKCPPYSSALQRLTFISDMASTIRRVNVRTPLSLATQLSELPIHSSIFSLPPSHRFSPSCLPLATSVILSLSARWYNLLLASHSKNI